MFTLHFFGYPHVDVQENEQATDELVKQALDFPDLPIFFTCHYRNFSHLFPEEVLTEVCDILLMRVAIRAPNISPASETRYQDLLVLFRTLLPQPVINLIFGIRTHHLRVNSHLVILILLTKIL